jgi:hypothetical protein
MPHHRTLGALPRTHAHRRFRLDPEAYRLPSDTGAPGERFGALRRHPSGGRDDAASPLRSRFAETWARGSEAGGGATGWIIFLA